MWCLNLRGPSKHRKESYKKKLHLQSEAFKCRVRSQGARCCISSIHPCSQHSVTRTRYKLCSPKLVSLSAQRFLTATHKLVAQKRTIEGDRATLNCMWSHVKQQRMVEVGIYVLLCFNFHLTKMRRVKWSKRKISGFPHKISILQLS